MDYNYDEFKHYGTKFHSGRYPWGSGDNPYQHSGDFLSRVTQLEKEGVPKEQIAKSHNLSLSEYEYAKKRAKVERSEALLAEARSRMANGESRSAVARDLGVGESTLRAYEKDIASANRNRVQNVVDILKKEIDEKGIIDVGEGVELELGITRSLLKQAMYNLEAQTGYYEGGIGVKNPTDPNYSHQTNTMVLCKDRDIYNQAYSDPSLIKSISDYHSADGGNTFNRVEYPSSLDSKRIQVRYAEDGGIKKDGVIEIRPGCKDLDLGDSHYAQVRVLVDGTHYLKGMAVYSDDLPEGCDVRFNTNNHKGTPMKGEKGSTVLKPIKDDPKNPFGATLTAKGQSHYISKDGKSLLSPINKLTEEGDYDTSSSKNLSSQFLSKQPLKLIRQQLDQTYSNKKDEYDLICSLDNPAVKKKLLIDFADGCDGAAVHMKAVGLPRQRRHVILPLETLKEDEVFAPNYIPGEKVALIRYPHAGRFEIPILTVNNKNPEGRKSIGTQAKDAVGINFKVAERLSGADFDGDTVIAIPISSYSSVKNAPRLEGLKDFEPKEKYHYIPGIRTMKKSEVQKEMGIISNLITDMTLKGAPVEDITKAARHSMTVIDAEKHKLDYIRSEIDNDIPQLKKKWQTGGASTLISRRKQDEEVPERKGSPKIDDKTGNYIYKESGRRYDERKVITKIDPETGKKVPVLDPVTGKKMYKEGKKNVLAMEKVPLVLNTPDLHTLSSGSAPEEAYADYGNKLKALANTARKESLTVPNLVYNKEAKANYIPQVESLNAKLEIALRNKPKERLAMRIANTNSRVRIEEGGILSREDKQKIRDQEVRDARAVVGADGGGTKINITDKEWEAIQSGAISHSKLMSILRYADSDRVRELAMPREEKALPEPRRKRLKALSQMGYTNSEIAEAIGASVSTVKRYLSDPELLNG